MDTLERVQETKISSKFIRTPNPVMSAYESFSTEQKELHEILTEIRICQNLRRARQHNSFADEFFGGFAEFCGAHQVADLIAQQKILIQKMRTVQAQLSKEAIDAVADLVDKECPLL